MIIVLYSLSNFAAEYHIEKFTKVCKRCCRITYEIQMYVYNEWTDSWQKSWRSDTNRPGCCEQCYYELQPKIKFLEKEKNAYNGNIQHLREQPHWWNNGKIEKFSSIRPLFGGPWYSGRLSK